MGAGGVPAGARRGCAILRSRAALRRAGARGCAITPDAGSAGPPPRGRIELKLRDVSQLFHTLDPSPFPERTLDDTAEDFIVGWARDYPRRTPLELVVHLAQPPRESDVLAVESAVHNHFRYLAENKRREFRQLMSRGRTSLLIGLAFLAVCLLAGNAVARLSDSPLAALGREGLLIGGWVAMWRPIEIFLYDWWSVRRQQLDYERLARIPVRLASAI